MHLLILSSLATRAWPRKDVINLNCVGKNVQYAISTRYPRTVACTYVRVCARAHARSSRFIKNRETFSSLFSLLLLWSVREAATYFSCPERSMVRSALLLSSLPLDFLRHTRESVKQKRGKSSGTECELSVGNTGLKGSEGEAGRLVANEFAGRVSSMYP